MPNFSYTDNVSGDKTKAEAERTGDGIIINNKGIGLPQTTFRSSLQTTVRLRLRRELSRTLTPKPYAALGGNSLGGER